MLPEIHQALRYLSLDPIPYDRAITHLSEIEQTAVLEPKDAYYIHCLMGLLYLSQGKLYEANRSLSPILDQPEDIQRSIQKSDPVFVTTCQTLIAGSQQASYICEYIKRFDDNFILAKAISNDIDLLASLSYNLILDITSHIKFSQGKPFLYQAFKHSLNKAPTASPSDDYPALCLLYLMHRLDNKPTKKLRFEIMTLEDPTKAQDNRRTITLDTQPTLFSETESILSCGMPPKQIIQTMMEIQPKIIFSRSLQNPRQQQRLRQAFEHLCSAVNQCQTLLTSHRRAETIDLNPTEINTKKAAARQFFCKLSIVQTNINISDSDTARQKNRKKLLFLSLFFFCRRFDVFSSTVGDLPNCFQIMNKEFIQAMIADSGKDIMAALYALDSTNSNEQRCQQDISKISADKRVELAARSQVLMNCLKQFTDEERKVLILDGRVLMTFKRLLVPKLNDEFIHSIESRVDWHGLDDLLASTSRSASQENRALAEDMSFLQIVRECTKENKAVDRRLTHIVTIREAAHETADDILRLIRNNSADDFSIITTLLDARQTILFFIRNTVFFQAVATAWPAQLTEGLNALFIKNVNPAHYFNIKHFKKLCNTYHDMAEPSKRFTQALTSLLDQCSSGEALIGVHQYCKKQHTLITSDNAEERNKAALREAKTLHEELLDAINGIDFNLIRKKSKKFVIKIAMVLKNPKTPTPQGLQAHALLCQFPLSEKRIPMWIKGRAIRLVKSYPGRTRDKENMFYKIISATERRLKFSHEYPSKAEYSRNDLRSFAQYYPLTPLIKGYSDFLKTHADDILKRKEISILVEALERGRHRATAPQPYVRSIKLLIKIIDRGRQRNTPSTDEEILKYCREKLPKLKKIWATVSYRSLRDKAIMNIRRKNIASAVDKLLTISDSEPARDGKETCGYFLSYTMGETSNSLRSRTIMYRKGTQLNKDEATCVKQLLLLSDDNFKKLIEKLHADLYRPLEITAACYELYQRYQETSSQSSPSKVIQKPFGEGSSSNPNSYFSSNASPTQTTFSAKDWAPDQIRHLIGQKTRKQRLHRLIRIFETITYRLTEDQKEQPPVIEMMKIAENHRASAKQTSGTSGKRPDLNPSTCDTVFGL